MVVQHKQSTIRTYLCDRLHLPDTLILALLRYLLRHPWQLGLALLGVALGVAVVISIDLTEASARRAFDLATQGTLGKSTHRIIGGPDGIDDNVYIKLKRDLSIRPATPIIEGQVQLPEQHNETLQVLGIDPFTDLEFRSFTPGAAKNGVQVPDYLGFFTRRGLVLSEETANRLGLKVGQTIPLQAGSLRTDGEIIALLAPGNAQDRAALADTLIMDIASAQEILQLSGRFSHIDLMLPTGTEEQAILDRLRAELPADLEVVVAASRGTTIKQMTQAFYLHLNALSLLALVVGIFLIYNTMSFVVVQQRSVLGILRAIGVTRRQVFTATLLQAGLLGLAGTLFGCLLGILLAHGLLSIVTRTINDIYFAVSVSEVSLDPWSIGKGVLLGVAGSLLAAFWPAREAANVNPRRSLLRSEQETRFRRSTLLAAGSGIVIVLFGLCLLRWTTHGMTLAFASLAALLVSAALLTPLCTWMLANLAQPLLHAWLGIMGRYAARNIVASLSRTAVATAALLLAIATTTSIALMVNSFRLAVDDWLQNLLRADFYVMANEHGSVHGPIDDVLLHKLASLPQVSHYSTARHVNIETANGLTQVVAYDFAPESYAGFQFLEGTPETIWPAYDNDEAVIVSEPYAFRYKTGPGQNVSLRTDKGEHRFKVVGVFRDYSTEHGFIAMSRRTYSRYWRDQGYGSVGLYVAPGTTTETLRTELGKLGPASARLKLTSNQELRFASLEVFDRTFAITGILRFLAGSIAFVGIFSALLALQLDRTRELGVLRACGLTPLQLGVAILTETGLLGTIAGVLAVPLGVAMAALLVFELNRHSFGWSMPLSIDAYTLATGLVLAIGAALLAGSYPAWRMARIQPASAIRDE